MGEPMKPGGNIRERATHCLWQRGRGESTYADGRAAARAALDLSEHEIAALSLNIVVSDRDICDVLAGLRGMLAEREACPPDAQDPKATEDNQQ